ncbi:BhlA/UviB family holin-like peptide [Fredinandcohnia humi]
MMEQSLLQGAMEQGLWAVLFVSLYLYQLHENRQTRQEARQREEQLTTFISDITKQFEALAKQYERMSDDIQEIKMEIRQK